MSPRIFLSIISASVEFRPRQTRELVFFTNAVRALFPPPDHMTLTVDLRVTMRLSLNRPVKPSNLAVFNLNVTNPSTLVASATLTIDIFDDSGAFVVRLTGTTSAPPHTTSNLIVVSWTPTRAGKFMFTATLTCAHFIGDLNGDGTPETVTGGITREGNLKVT